MQFNINSPPHLAVHLWALWPNFNGIFDEADVHIFIPHIQIYHKNDCLQQTEYCMQHYKFRYTSLKKNLRNEIKEIITSGKEICLKSKPLRSVLPLWKLEWRVAGGEGSQGGWVELLGLYIK